MFLPHKGPSEHSFKNYSYHIINNNNIHNYLIYIYFLSPLQCKRNRKRIWFILLITKNINLEQSLACRKFFLNMYFSNVYWLFLFMYTPFSQLDILALLCYIPRFSALEPFIFTHELVCFTRQNIHNFSHPSRPTINVTLSVQPTGSNIS